MRFSKIIALSVRIKNAMGGQNAGYFNVTAVGRYIFYHCALKGWTLCRASIRWSAGALGTLNTRGQ